jgi:peptidyl-prolyl cis-trans isomerase SurA
MKISYQFLTAFLFFAFAFGPVSAQTLETIGNQAVSKDEFLKAFQKNNSGKTVTEQSYRDYLELYTRYKLKVKAAYDMKLDTLPNQLVEMKNFRNQVVDSYIKDEETLNKMVNEAFVRGQKDIHLAHILITIPPKAMPADTLGEFKKATEAYNNLKQGKSFGDIASIYSDDPTANSNHGDIGYITVFSLPYEMENAAYNLQPGQYSRPFRTKGAYHIFKNLGERKAIGRMRTSQILFAFPPGASEPIKISVKQKADSVYSLLAKGEDFAELAKKFSGDNLSYQTGGEMAEFGVGKYEPAFETAAFALAKDGDFSRPVETAFGYHIIKRLGKKPSPTAFDKETADMYRQKVSNDLRNEYAKKSLLQKVLLQENYKRSTVDENNLWIYTDSAIQHKRAPVLAGMNDKTILLSLGKKNVSVNDWLNYIKPLNTQVRPGDNKKNNELFDQFVQSAAFEYYRAHLEDYNKDFAGQLIEFREGNLLFEIMQRRIWDKASADSMGLVKYFEAHKDKYWWGPSADAILFTCTNENAATKLQKKLPDNIQAWRILVDSSGGMVQADSGRFELAQLPMAEKNAFSAGQFTSLLSNQNDNTVTFAYIVKVYNERSPRSYADARGFVINDFQSFLEDKWIAELKSKYPVKVDEAVFRSLPH